MTDAVVLTADNLDAQIDLLLDGKSTLVDPDLVRWADEDYKELAQVGDKRKLSKRGNVYDNVFLLWSFISSRADLENDHWANVRRDELLKIVNDPDGIAELKRLFDAQGWAQWKQGTPHQMQLNPTGQPIAVKLKYKTTDRILGNYTCKDPACFDARLALEQTEIVEDEAREIIRQIYLAHIHLRDEIRNSGVSPIPRTRKEENKWWDTQDCDEYQTDGDYDGHQEYSRWLINKAARVSASIINPVRQIRSGKGAVFRVDKVKGHRLFTPFTFLKRELRKAVRLQGEELVALDIRSCQPTLLANATEDKKLLDDCLDNQFYSRIGEHLEANSTHPCSPYPILEDYFGGMCEEQIDWATMVYPTLRTPDRERAKFALMEYLFGPNQYPRHEGSDRHLIQEFMFENYRKTAKHIFALKESHNYAQVARELQANESDLFIDKYYCTDLREAGILGLTVHDAVYVSESDADEAEKLFRQRIQTEKIRAKLDRE